MADDRPEDIGTAPDLGRPRRAAPTLDLDANEISDESQQADAGNAAEKTGTVQPMWSSPTVVLAAMVSVIFGVGGAAFVIWTTSWPGARPPEPPPLVNSAPLDALAARVAGIESKLAAPAAPAAPDPGMAAQIGALEKSVASLRDELAAAGARSQQLAAVVETVKSAPREVPPPP